MSFIFHSKVTWLIGLLVAAVLSFFCIAPHMTQPSTYQNSLNTLQGKQETVLELTAVSAAASTAITVLPGDVATPIADTKRRSPSRLGRSRISSRRLA